MILYNDSLLNTLKFFNNIKGDLNLINEALTSDKLPIQDHWKPFNNLDNIPDEEMGYQEPRVTLSFKASSGSILTTDYVDPNLLQQQATFGGASTFLISEADNEGLQNYEAYAEWRSNIYTGFDNVCACARNQAGGGYDYNDPTEIIVGYDEKHGNTIFGIDSHLISELNSIEIWGIKDGQITVFTLNAFINDLLVGRVWSGVRALYNPQGNHTYYGFTKDDGFNFVRVFLTSIFCGPNSASGYEHYNYDIDFSVNFWIFQNPSECQDYLNGIIDYSTALNFNGNLPPKKEDETKTRLYYINSKIFESDNATSGEKTLKNHNRLEIKLNTDIKRPFALKVDDESQRMTLIIRNGVTNDDIISMRESQDGGETWHNVNFDTFHNSMWRYTEITQLDNGKYQSAETRTNIPIFKTNAKISLYFNGVIDETSGLNPTNSILNDITNKLIDIGTGLKIKNDLNIQRVRTSMSEIIWGDYNFFEELANTLNNDSIVTQIVEGLKMHNNPQDVFIDMFALPFDISNIVSDKHNKHDLDFGTYTHTFENGYNVISHPKEIKMFETYIKPIFNDWRDYQLQISLYLPYCNIISLPVDVIMDNLLTCYFVFDVISATIKYYIKCNNVTILTVEGNVRYNLPLSANNQVQGFMQKLGGASQIIQSSQDLESGQVNAITSALQLMDSASGENPSASGIASSVGGLVSAKHQITNSFIGFGKGVANILKPTPRQYSGNYSNSTAFYDELSAYLIIEQALLLYDDNIPTHFNLPDNRVSTLSVCEGYTEIDYIDLQSACTESERDKIYQLLNSGFYV